MGIMADGAANQRWPSLDLGDGPSGSRQASAAFAEFNFDFGTAQASGAAAPIVHQEAVKVENLEIDIVPAGIDLVPAHQLVLDAQSVWVCVGGGHGLSCDHCDVGKERRRVPLESVVR